MVEVFGRDRELVMLRRFLDRLCVGFGAFLLEGEAGIGKTTLWRAAITEAEERGYRVLVSRPAEMEASLVYAGLADLLAGVSDDVLGALPEPQARALSIALLRAAPDERVPEPRTIMTAFVGLVGELANDAPVLVAVDDVQWLDRPSLRAIEFAARRLGDRHAGIVASVRTGPGGPAAREPLLESLERVRLEPLTPAGLHRLIKASTGESLPRPTLLRIHRESGGNAFFALEIARVLVASGIPRAREAWPLPADVRELVDARVRVLSPAVQTALLEAAVVSQPTASTFRPSDLRRAAAAEIVTVDAGRRVRFTHPLFASAIYLGASPAQRRAAHAKVAGDQIDVEERARHLALAADGADGAVAALLDEAAEGARSRGAPDVAAELGERARQLTPNDQPEAAARRGLVAVGHLLHAGDVARARSLAATVAGELEPGPSSARAYRLLGEACYQEGAVEEAVQHLRRAIDASEGTPAERAHAELDLVFVQFQSFGDFEAGYASAQGALASAALSGDDPLLGTALATSTMTAFMTGRGLDEEKLKHALELEDFDRSSLTEARPSMTAGWLMLYVGCFDRAREIFGRLRDRLVARGDDGDLSQVLTALAQLECTAGDISTAGDLAEEAFELARQAGSEIHAADARARRALVDAMAGDESAARASAREAIELSERSGWRIAGFWGTCALGFLELSLGNVEASASVLAFSTRLVESDGVIEPSRRPFLPDSIEALVALGDLERAERLTDMLEERGRALDRPWAIMTAARCRGFLLAARGETPAALEAVERGLRVEARLPMPLEIARTLLVRGQLLRRSKRKRAARASLERALDICDDIGATLWAASARRELDRLGPRRDPTKLTATEERVATLAASGLTNRQVAAAAFMSEKTVEANLSRIYRKLGIRSRAQLGVRLQAYGRSQL